MRKFSEKSFKVIFEDDRDFGGKRDFRHQEGRLKYGLEFILKGKTEKNLKKNLNNTEREIKKRES